MLDRSHPQQLIVVVVVQALMDDLLMGRSMASLTRVVRSAHPHIAQLRKQNAKTHALVCDIITQTQSQRQRRQQRQQQQQQQTSPGARGARGAGASSSVQESSLQVYGHLMHTLRQAPQLLATLGGLLPPREQTHFALFLTHSLFDRSGTNILQHSYT